MRKILLAVSRKLRFRCCGVYTWLLRSGLKRCGDGVRFEFPIRLEEPQLITVGNQVHIYPRAWINPVAEWAGVRYDGEVIIGNNSKIGYGVQISAARSVVIEEDIAIAAGAVIVDHIHDHMHLEMPIFYAPLSEPAPVRIGRGSFLGVHCFIGPGVQIGEHAVVAANAVVTKDVPAYCTAVGNPARVIRFHAPKTENDPVDGPYEVQLG